MASRKKKAYQPDRWESSGFCRTCFKPIEARYCGEEVQHVDGTAYCVPVVRKTSDPVDEWATTEDAQWLQDEALSQDEDCPF